MISWDGVLDELEERIVLTEAALDTGDDIDASVLIPFAPPAELGVLPERLHERALDILRRQGEVEQRLTTAAQLLGADLIKTREATSASRRFARHSEDVVPQYFNQSV